jgi:hypothetical protein
MSTPCPAAVEAAELKPCPFCGGSAYCDNDRVCPRVHCSERTCSIYDFSVSAHFWNTRAIDAEVASRTKELEQNAKHGWESCREATNDADKHFKRTKELEEQLAAVTTERDAACNALRKLMSAIQTRDFCGLPDFKTVDDLIIAMKNVVVRFDAIHLKSERDQALASCAEMRAALEEIRKILGQD